MLIKLIITLSLVVSILSSYDFRGPKKDEPSVYYLNDGVVKAKINYKYRIWSLLGTPIDLLDARWMIESIDFKNEKDKEQKAKLYNIGTSYKYKVCDDGIERGCISKKLMREVVIIDLKFKAFIYANNVFTKYGTVEWKDVISYYIISPDVMSKPGIDSNYGEWSYSTPTGHDWDKLIKDKYTYEYVSSKKAKGIIKRFIRFEKFEIENIEYGLGYVKNMIIAEHRKIAQAKLDKIKSEKRAQFKKEKEKRELERKKARIKREKEILAKAKAGMEEDPFAELEDVYDKVLEIEDDVKITAKYKEENIYLQEKLDTTFDSIQNKLNQQIKDENARILAKKNKISNKGLPTPKDITSFYDSDSKLYGFKNSNTENIFIEATYDEVKQFYKGQVLIFKNGYIYFIDIQENIIGDKYKINSDFYNYTTFLVDGKQIIVKVKHEIFDRTGGGRCKTKFWKNRYTRYDMQGNIVDEYISEDYENSLCLKLQR